MTAREWKAGDRALIEVEIDEVDDGTVWVLVTGRPKGARRAHVQVATDALLSLPEPSGEDVIERSREVLGAHHPVVGKFAHLNPVVGCQCMDRVFIAGQENYPSHIRDVLAAAGLLANPDAIRERSSGEVRIEGTWLVRDVGKHTCGTAMGGHYGAHEPGCGTVPEVNLATLPGWDAVIQRAKAEGAREALLKAADKDTSRGGMVRSWLKGMADRIGGE